MQHIIAGEVLKELRGRVGFLLNVGLHYLTLDRSAPTLSGGELSAFAWRARSAAAWSACCTFSMSRASACIRATTSGCCTACERLRDMGNTVIVVEHDEDTMRAADYLVDFGPGPGVRGGEVVAAGDLCGCRRHPTSLTGQYLSRRKSIAIPADSAGRTGRQICTSSVPGTQSEKYHVSIPLGLFVCVTGVSGSGKVRSSTTFSSKVASAHSPQR